MLFREKQEELGGGGVEPAPLCSLAIHNRQQLAGSDDSTADPVLVAYAHIVFKLTGASLREAAVLCFQVGGPQPLVR